MVVVFDTASGEVEYRDAPERRRVREPVWESGVVPMVEPALAVQPRQEPHPAWLAGVDVERWLAALEE